MQRTPRFRPSLLALPALLLAALLAACAPPAERAAPEGEQTEATETEATEAAAAQGDGESSESSAWEPANTDPVAAAFAGPIERSHGAEAWYEREAVKAHVTLTFGGEEVLAGTLTFTTDMGEARIDTADGVTAVWDGVHAWVSPADAELPRARFHLLTWPYFLSAPMKLRDPGTHIEDLGPQEMRGKTYDVARLTFEPGTGDTPDDWYVLYRDPETDRLEAMAYVVTYGTTLAEAEAEPHAITYEDSVKVDGVEIPTVWRFWLWSEEEGIHGEPLGRLDLSDVRFVEPEPGTFSRPDDAREDEMPGT